MYINLQFFADEEAEKPRDIEDMQPVELVGDTGVIGEAQLKKANEILKDYKQGKQNLEKRIIENNKWYELRQWEVIQDKAQHSDENKPKPRSAWLLNSISNKHGDAMDNYPVPAILPREENDQDEAKKLNSIIPVIMSQNGFETTYSDNWWYKLKNGCSIYGIFWNNNLLKGLGNIDIKSIDILNVFWQPGIKDIQKSRNFFAVDLVDNDILETMYPILKDKLGDGAVKLEEYVYEDKIDTSNKSMVVDWYYKKTNSSGLEVVHYVKYVNTTVIYASENDPTYAERGFYDHAKYPFVFDTLFPMVNSPAGMGYIDIMKDTQMQIDKLDQIIMTNTSLSGLPRWLKSNQCNINMKEYTDANTQFVTVNGKIDDSLLKQIEVKPLDSWIQSYHQIKIDELKETSNNRDISNGGVTGGVTSGAGISALQEASNKLSRDMIKASYRAYEQICEFVIELIRQFYDEAREFRILGENNQTEFIKYDNSGIKVQEGDNSRLALFDLNIKAQKSNPFSRMSQNELAKELMQMGCFNPELADQTLIMLELMDFEGKDTILDKINTSKTLKTQLESIMQSLSMLAPQLAPMIIQQASMLAQQSGNNANQPMPTGSATSGQQNPLQVAQLGALNNSTTPYQQTLAERSMADINDSGKVQ